MFVVNKHLIYLTIFIVLCAGCSKIKNVLILEEDRPIRIEHEGSVLEIAKDGENAEVGVIVGGDVVFAFTITDDQAVSTVSTIDYSNEKTVFILDDNGNGFADFKISVNHQNEVVVKNKIESRVVEEN